MDTNQEFDPFGQAGNPSSAPVTSNIVSEEARKLQARVDAFRDLADRFYMVWWNLPKMPPKEVDSHLQDMFRMYMDLAPSMGVSRVGIPELKECCGRKRTWEGDELGQGNDILIMSPAGDQRPKEDLGWCPGDIIRRITRFFGAGYCKKCDQRRRWINAFFRCGGGDVSVPRLP